MWKFVGRFFEPALKQKWVTTKMLFESSFNGIWYDLIPIFSLPYLTVLVTERRIEDMKYFVTYIILLYVIMWFVAYWIRRWDMEAKYAYQEYINDTYRSVILLKDSLHLDRIGTGKLQSILQKGYLSWANLNWQLPYQIPRALVIIISGIYVTFSFGLWFTMLFLILLFISLVGYIYYKRKYIEYEHRLQDEENDLNSNSVRLIMSRGEVVLAGKVEYEVKKLSGHLEKMRGIVGRGAKYDFLSDLFISGSGVVLPFMGVLAIVIVNDYSGLQVYDLGIITAFMYFSVRFSGMLYYVSYMVNLAVDEYPKIKKFWDFLDDVPNTKHYYEGEKYRFIKGAIRFSNVSFEYRQSDKPKNLEANPQTGEVPEENEEVADRRIVLTNFNLEIAGGEKVALIGRSGSGKTTLVKLLTGYMQPTAGKILIDGQDLKKMSLKSYYEHVGYLTQEPGVFDGTIRENLLYGTTGSKKNNDAEILHALSRAQCDFVFKTKKGIDSHIGEKGVRLSGGERQRLAIAKLFLKNPNIIILDEPTAALDSFSEELITKALDELFVGRTVIVIAHRLQTVRNADRIIVLERGEIIEEGNHETLLLRQGHYARMLNMQGGL